MLTEDFDFLPFGNKNEGYYGPVGDNDFPIANYMHSVYGFPSRIIVRGANNIDGEFFKWFKENIVHFLLFNDGAIEKKNRIYIKEYVYELPNLKSIVRFIVREPSKPIGESNFNLDLFFTDLNLIQVFLDKMSSYFSKRTYDKSNIISLIVQEGLEISTIGYTVKLKALDVALNYGDDFVPVFNKIISRLNNKNDKGIVLLHGVPGTGKTSLIKYIAKKTRKEIIFVPPSMAEAITSPGFIPFLMNHSNSILIIEDAERILTNRNQQGANQGVSNILNLSDGILGDCLNIQVIATFNTNLTNIDSALLRKGRLIAEHEFKKLDVAQSNKLLRHLGFSFIATEPMALTDIYNIEETEFKTQQPRRSVGFNSK